MKIQIISIPIFWKIPKGLWERSFAKFLADDVSEAEFSLNRKFYRTRKVGFWNVWNFWGAFGALCVKSQKQMKDEIKCRLLLVWVDNDKITWYLSLKI